VVTQKCVENVCNILSEDPNKNIQELANDTGISVGSVCTVLHIKKLGEEQPFAM
jgi:hypothetical protein